MKTGVKVFLAVVVVFGVLWGITAATWGLGVATAGIYGRGEAHKEIQSKDFRLAAYQTFFNQCASIQGLEGQIDEFTALLEQYEKGSREYNMTLTNLAGVKGMRHQAIAKYNQDSMKDYMEAQFKDNNLPWQIPATSYPTQGGKTICATR